MKNKTGIILIIVFALVFLVTSVLFKVFGITDIWAQLTGTLLGTIITAIVTVLLLGVQTNKEISHDRDVGVFEKKQEVYHNFIEELEKITQDGKVNIPSDTNPDKTDELQHLIYQLGFVQMHASKNLAEKITESVGKLLTTISMMQSKDKDGKKINELYSDLAENVFTIVSLLKNDLYNPNKKDEMADEKQFKAVSKEKFGSALRASGAFDNEFLSESRRAENLAEFLALLKSNFEKTYKTTVYFGENENENIKAISKAYFAVPKNKRWIFLKVFVSADIAFVLTFSEDGDIWHNFFDGKGMKTENVNTVLTEKYHNVYPKDVYINFLDTNNSGYKSFARLYDDEDKRKFVQNYVSNILAKIETVTKQEENTENL